MDFGTIKRKLKVQFEHVQSKNIVDSYQALDDTLKSLDETADAIKEVFDEELMALAEEEYDAMAKRL